jgi:hypothetical protein
VETLSPRFTVGWLILTPGALFALVEAQEDPRDFIHRHLIGDWGDAGPAEWAANEYAVRHGGPLFSVYHTRHGRTLWVRTEASRYATMILLPQAHPKGRETKCPRLPQ